MKITDSSRIRLVVVMTSGVILYLFNDIDARRFNTYILGLTLALWKEETLRVGLESTSMVLVDVDLV